MKVSTVIVLRFWQTEETRVCWTRCGSTYQQYSIIKKQYKRLKKQQKYY